MLKVLGIVTIGSVFLMTYALCRAASIADEYEGRDD